MDNYPSYPSSGSSSQRHPIYRGIRMRAGKWVTEIREPGTTTRIWLGTFPTPEMAATAYDVASIALKGSKAVVNFPEWVHFYSLPASHSANDIRVAASAAAAARAQHQSQYQTSEASYEVDQYNRSDINYNESSQLGSHQEFIDEEALLDMPNLLRDMAGGMLLSPPRLINPPHSSYSYDSPDHNNSGGCGNLWGYSYSDYYQ